MPNEKQEEDDDDKLTYTGKEGEYCKYSGPMACNAHHAALSPSDEDDIVSRDCFVLF